METMTIILIMVAIFVVAGGGIIYWNLFRKKKKLPFEFKVAAFVPDVESIEHQTSIECKLTRDPTDQLLYIVDTQTGGTKFKELYPGENKKTFSLEELPKLKKKLESLDAKIKNTPDKSLDNVLNLKKEASKLRVLIKQYEEPKGSFVIKLGGVKTIFYIRKSTGNEAVHWDIHSNLAFSPTDKNSRDLFTAWKTKHENLKKDEKAPFEKITQAIAAVVLCILVIVLALLVWHWLQMDIANQKAMEIQKYVCQQVAVDGFLDMTATNQETSNMLNDFANNMLKGQAGNLGPTTEPIK